MLLLVFAKSSFDLEWGDKCTWTHVNLYNSVLKTINAFFFLILKENSSTYNTEEFSQINSEM